MKEPETKYDVSAKYYDQAYSNKEDYDDSEYYLDLARKSGKGPVLEIACGTGRILLPIAQEGIEIFGVDASEPMLDVLKGAIERQPKEIQERIRIAKNDMRDFSLGEKFPLVIIPFRPLQHLYTVDDQIAALRCAKEHLAENGTIAFNVFYPRFDLLEKADGKEELEVEWTNPANPDQTVRRYFLRKTLNKIHQYFTGDYLYRTYEDGTLISEETQPFKMGYYTYPHMVALFKNVGLSIRKEYGSFDRTPMDNTAQEMVFELEHQSI